jgi:hypothetical protein
MAGRVRVDGGQMPLLSVAREVGGSDTVVVAPRTWLRNRRRTRVWASLATAWSVAILAVMALPGALPGAGATAATVAVDALHLLVAAPGAVLAWRVARAGLWVGPDAIVIHGPFATRTIALPDATRFTPGLQGGGGNGVPCPLLSRTDGPPAGVWALGRRNVWFDYDRLCAEIQPLCDELNALVATQRPAH